MIPVESQPQLAPDSSGIIQSDWLAYQAWCEVHGLATSSPDALSDFAKTLSPTSARQARRRLSQLRSAAGITPSPALPVAPRPPADPELLRGALAELSRVGEGPDAARARRDAVVLLLLLDLQLSRREALRARARTYPLLGIGTHDYAIGQDARTCRACALSRWLHTLAHARLPLDEPRVARPPEHDCIYAVPEGWAAGPLLPEINRWGQIQAYSRHALTPRALTQIVRDRTTGQAQPGDDDSTTDSPIGIPAPLPPSMTVAEAARRRRALREELNRA